MEQLNIMEHLIYPDGEEGMLWNHQLKYFFSTATVKPRSEKYVCHQDSLPLNFDTTVENNAREGLYQISMAAKEIESHQISRSVLECGLTFIGFIDFKNMLREETSEVLRQLEDSKVRCVMVTGDSILTGIHVAKECSMIKCKKVLVAMSIDEEGDIIWVDELDNVTPPPRLESRNLEDYGLAMSGAVWDHILKKDHCKALELIEHVSVFGRCTPGNKV
jgi:magnesium-transporting ATPase (P-type)